MRGLGDGRGVAEGIAGSQSRSQELEVPGGLSGAEDFRDGEKQKDRKGETEETEMGEMDRGKKIERGQGYGQPLSMSERMEKKPHSGL